MTKEEFIDNLPHRQLMQKEDLQFSDLGRFEKIVKNFESGIKLQFAKANQDKLDDWTEWSEALVNHKLTKYLKEEEQKEEEQKEFFPPNEKKQDTPQVRKSSSIWGF